MGLVWLMKSSLINEGCIMIYFSLRHMIVHFIKIYMYLVCILQGFVLSDDDTAFTTEWELQVARKKVSLWPSQRC